MRVKLVRDDMKMDQGGRTAPANSLPGKQVLLVAKLHEEAEEIARRATDPYEYADLLEAMLELARINGVPWSDIEEAFLKKRAERGAFRSGRTWIIDEPDARVPPLLQPGGKT